MTRTGGRLGCCAIALSMLAAVVHSQAAITFEDIAHPKPGEWPTYNGDLSGNRHSRLDQIDVRNVNQLGLKWKLKIGGERALQGTPIVADGVMYVTAVNEADALDPKTGREIWKFSRPPTPGLVPTGDPA